MDTSLLTALTGFAGVIVGSVITYLTQWFIVRRQRQWTIEDNKVQHQRAVENEMRQRRYERLKQKVDVISSQVGLKITLLGHVVAYEIGESSAITKEERAELSKRIEAKEGEVDSTLMATASEELLKLHRTLNSHFYSATETLDSDQLNKAWEAAQAVHRKMETLLDEALLK